MVTYTPVYCFIILAAFHSYVTAGCTVCPNNWIRYENSCYLFADAYPLNWASALHYCSTHQSHLAVVETDSEHNFIHQFALRLFKNAADRSHVRFWLAGTDTDQEGHWVWHDTNITVAGNHWFPGQPAGSSSHQHEQDCLAMVGAHGFKWNDFACGLAGFPICELEVESVFEPYKDLIG